MASDQFAILIQFLEDYDLTAAKLTGIERNFDIDRTGPLCEIDFLL